MNLKHVTKRTGAWHHFRVNSSHMLADIVGIAEALIAVGTLGDNSIGIFTAVLHVLIAMLVGLGFLVAEWADFRA